MENAPKKLKAILLIEDRKKVELNNVEAVLSFEDDYVSLATGTGKVTIEGSEMKIVDLSKDNGHILIIGTVTSISYDEDGKRKRSGLFR